MKQSKLLVSLLLLGVVLARGEESSNYSPESRAFFETFTSKVLKVYSFQEGDYEYVAYVVNWKDYEVVVVPPFLKTAEDTRYNVGDTIKCQMQQTFHQIGDSNKTRITFSVIPTVKSPRKSPGTPEPQKSP